MSRWLRSFVLALACAHLTVATVPCRSTGVGAPVAPPRVAERMSHSASSHHGSAHEGSASPMAHHGSAHEVSASPMAHHGSAHEVSASPMAHHGSVSSMAHHGSVSSMAHHGSVSSMAHHESAHHGSASSTAHDHEVMPMPAHESADSGWKAPCPCGCDRAPGSDLPGHKLDPGLLLARISAPAAFARVLHAPTAPATLAVFPDGPDRVPIFA